MPHKAQKRCFRLNLKRFSRSVLICLTSTKGVVALPVFNHRTSRVAAFTILLCALSCFASISSAVEKKESVDLAAYKELAQVRLESTRDLLQKDIQAFSSRIDFQDKRLDTQSAHIDQNLSMLGNVLSVLGIVLTLAGLAGYLSVARKAKSEAQIEARKEAKVTANDWFEVHANELQTRLDAMQSKLQELEGQAESDFNLHLQRVQAGADLAIKGMQISVSEPTTDKPIISVGTASALAEAAIAAKNKPESAYTYQDWNNRAFDAFSNENKELAIRFWFGAASVDSASPEDISQAMLNAGSVLMNLNRYDEALSTFDELIQRFDGSDSKNLKLQVATAFSQKIACLGNLKRREELISLADTFIHRFAKDELLAGSSQIAHIMLNKTIALGTINRKEEALEACEDFIRLLDQEQNPEITRIYIRLQSRKIALLWDLDRFEEANETFEQTLKRFQNDKNQVFALEISNVKNTKGFKLLCQAKKVWHDIENRMNYLRESERLFDEAVVGAPDNALILGNQAYCGYLLDLPRSYVRDKLTQALILGGEWLYDATQTDLLIATVAEKDDAFRVLLDDVWKSVRKPGISLPN